MNNTVILTQLSITVAELTRCSEIDAEHFLREFFQLAVEKLEADGRVTISGIGTFMVTDETIDFAPDPEIAEAINAPFAAFEAVELPDEIEESNKAAEAEAAEFGQEEDANVPQVPEPEPEPEPEQESEAEPESEGTHRLCVPASETISSVVEEVPVDEPVRRHNLWSIFWWVAACIASFALGWFAGSYEPVGLSGTLAGAVPVEIVEPEDTVEAVEEPVDIIEAVKPAAEPVTDTIRAGRFLTTIAREHYGCMEYWVYIYEANASRLGHPDRLSAGTTVVIPSADSLGLRAGDEIKIAEAERLASEIYRRFN